MEASYHSIPDSGVTVIPERTVAECAQRKEIPGFCVCMLVLLSRVRQSQQLFLWYVERLQQAPCLKEHGPLIKDGCKIPCAYCDLNQDRRKDRYPLTSI